MPNLFIRTRFDFAEEDRLTNALMSVLEHSDRRVLSRLLSLALGYSVPVSDGDDVHFDLQVRLRQSRPDARIRLPGLQVYIETKIGSGLDDRGHEQLRQHHDGLRRKHGRNALVALTSARRPPDLLSELAMADPNVDVRHLSWGEVLRLVVELQDDFQTGEATHLLLNQLEEYLRHQGYFYFEGIPMTDMLDYASALRSVRDHERTTRRQLVGLLQGIIEDLNGQPGIPTRTWNVQVFKGDDRFEEHLTNFEFVTAEVPDLGTAHAHFRVLPEVGASEGFRLRYYFTFHARTDGERALVRWLLNHRDEIGAEVGQFLDFNHVTERLFHASKVLAGDLAVQLLTGEPGAVSKVAGAVGAYFSAIHAWLIIGQAQVNAQTPRP